MTTSAARTVTTDEGVVSYDDTGDGDLLVALHSLLTDRHAFDPLIPQLDRRVVSVDLPGFGATDPVAGRIESFADLMAAAVHEIGGGDRPATVVGNGLGAFVALGVAIRHPHLVRALVLVGCGATFPAGARPALTKMIELAESGGMEAVIPIALQRLFRKDYLDAHPDEAEERARVLRRTDPGAFMNACRALSRVDYTEEAPGLEAPTLIVVGEHDQATPPEMAAGLHDLLPSSTLTVLPGVAHAPQLQDPTSFLRTVDGFLEGVG